MEGGVERPLKIKNGDEKMAKKEILCMILNREFIELPLCPLCGEITHLGGVTLPCCGELNPYKEGMEIRWIRLIPVEIVRKK